MTMKLEIGKVFQNEKDKLLAFIRNRVDNLSDAEDILQDVFYQTLEGASVTTQIDNLLGWIYTVTRNKIIDTYRKRKPVSSSLEKIEGGSLYQLIDNSGLHPEKVFDRQLIEEALTEAIESLPEEQRMVFILQELDGMTFKEISKFTGESINTLLSRKRYAVQFLRKELKEIKSIIDEM